MKYPLVRCLSSLAHPRLGTRSGAALLLCLSLFFAFALVACQTTTEEDTASAPEVAVAEDSNESGSAVQDSQTGDAAAETVAIEEQANPQPEPLSPDEGWNAGPHANTYVLDSSGRNDRCARCHSPAEWLPGPDDIPESCLTCKFDVDEPDPLISEEGWGHVDCRTCHRVKGDDVDAEYVWLDIAVIEEYIEVDSTTDLCRKCHEEEDVPDHKPAVDLSEDHQELSCTDCHDAHQTATSCVDSDCHADVVAASGTIAGHDTDHQLVSCMACHDAAGLEVGPMEESGLWVTFTTIPSGDAQTVVPHASHQTQIEVACDRCHFAGNAWGLSEDVQAES